jgi:hypothetical protein
MAILPLRKTAASPPPPPSLERTKLAETIAALREAEVNHTALIAANDYGGPAALAEQAARDALERAHVGLEQAKADAVTALVDGIQPPGATIAQARAAIQAAEDDIVTAVTVRQTLQERLEPAKQLVERLRYNIDVRLTDVIKAEVSIDALLADLDRAYREIVDKGRLLDLLTGADRIPRHGPAADPRTPYLWSLLTQAPMSWTLWQGARAFPAADEWKAALERLKTDATAPLPGVPG